MLESECFREGRFPEDVAAEHVPLEHDLLVEDPSTRRIKTKRSRSADEGGRYKLCGVLEKRCKRFANPW